jgi:hypothetical protein
MTFLNPLFLIGLLSAAIPLVIHLTRSRRTKRMPFSTTRFFTDQFLRSYRMSQVKELLLLAFRMALCALFALGLAKPLLRPPGGLVFGRDRAVVFVLDNSASMGYQAAGRALIDQARAAALQVLDGLESGSTAGVVLAGRRARGPERIFPELTTAAGDVRQALERVAAASLATDLAGAVAAARTLVRTSPAPGKEIYVLSDFQATGWDLSAEAPEPDDDVAVFLVPVRPASFDNAGVTAVQYAAARPMLGVPFAVRAAVRNDGPLPRTLTARLFVDGGKDPVGERRIEVGPNRWQIVRFHYTFGQGGWHSGKIAIDADALAADDTRYFAFDVQQSIRLLAVNGAPSAVPREDELFFLRTALTAAAPAESPLRVDTIAAAHVESVKLADYPLVVLANVEALSNTAVEQLEQFADRGGNLLVFLGDRVNRDLYNRLLVSTGRLHGGLLPGRLGDVWPAGSPATPPGAGPAGVAPPTNPEMRVVVTAVDYEHPALATFQDPKHGNLSSVSLRRLVGIEPSEGAAVLMRGAAGGGTAMPLLLEKRFGRGRVMLFASTCDRDWTDFPLRPAFVPWLYRVVSYLAQERLAGVPIYATGAAVPVPFSAGEGLPQVTVRKPDGNLGRAELTGDAAAPLQFADTAEPGVYTMSERGREATPALFVTNLDGDESQFEPLAEAELRELLGAGRQVTYVADPSRVGEASLSARRGVRFWDVFLVLALGIALFEPWLANRISLRHYGRPDATAERPARRGGRFRFWYRQRRTESATPAPASHEDTA